MAPLAPVSKGNRQRLRGAPDARRFFASGMAGLASERLCVAHLGADGALLGVSLGYARRADRITVPLRRIASDALRLNTHAMVIAHNHPSGDPTPSAADRRATARIADIADALGIALHDHLVFASRDCRSFRALGLL